MPRTSPSTITVMFLFACGGGGSHGSTGSTSTADASSGSFSSSDATTGPATGSMTTATTGEPGTSGPGTTPGTSGESSSTGSGGESTTASTGGSTGGDGAEYAAFWWSGGLQHLIVRKLDAAHGRCTTLELAWPIQSPPGFTLVLPDEWGVQSASIQQDIGDCLSDWQPAPELVPAKGGTGTAGFMKDPMQFCAMTVDVDVTLSFDPAMPWIPAEDVLTAVAVPVQGCP